MKTFYLWIYYGWAVVKGFQIYKLKLWKKSINAIFKIYLIFHRRWWRWILDPFSLSQATLFSAQPGEKLYNFIIYVSKVKLVTIWEFKLNLKQYIPENKKNLKRKLNQINFCSRFLFLNKLHFPHMYEWKCVKISCFFKMRKKKKKVLCVV